QKMMNSGITHSVHGVAHCHVLTRQKGLCVWQHFLIGWMLRFAQQSTNYLATRIPPLGSFCCTVSCACGMLIETGFGDWLNSTAIKNPGWRYCERLYIKCCWNYRIQNQNDQTRLSEQFTKERYRTLKQSRCDKHVLYIFFDEHCGTAP